MTDPVAPASDESRPEATTPSAQAPAPAPAPQSPPSLPLQQPQPSPQYGTAAPYGLAPAPVPPAAAGAWVQPVFAVAPQPKGLSLTSMILGLVSIFFFWTFVCPVVGLVFACIGLKKEPAGRGFAITGLVLNGILVLIPVSIAVFALLSSAALLGTAATTAH